MKNTEGSSEAKRRAGKHAADLVDDGDVVGLGTGSTAAHAIRALGREVEAGLDVEGVPTSFQAREIAIEVGIPLTTLDEADVALAIDGADQIAGADLVKGGGGAHAREKIVDAAADRLLVVADPTKEADVLDAIRNGTTRVDGRRAPIRMAAKHYVGAAGRKSGYYARTGAVRGATATRRGVAEVVSTARVAVSQGAHRAARVLSWVT